MVDEQAQAPGTDEIGPDDVPAPEAAADAAGPDAAGPDAAGPETGGPETGGPETGGPETGDGAGAGGPADPAGPAMTQVTLRHAPRYRAFIVTGIVAGLIAALLLVTLLPVAGGVSARTVFVYLALPLVLFGGLGGAAAALLVERRR